MPFQELEDWRAWQRSFERICSKFTQHELFDETYLDVSYATLRREGKPWAKALVADFRADREDFGVATAIEIFLDKKRTLYRFPLPDLVLHGVVARMLDERLEPVLSDQLFSYRKGRSVHQAVRQVSEWMQERKGEFYVLRRDVRKYTESIPLAEGSPLWPMLRERIAMTDENVAWMKKLLRFRYFDLAAPDLISQTYVGLPVGSPLNTSIANLYLSPVDELLDSVPGGIYVRFGDDLLFCHPDGETARTLAAEATKKVEGLRLEFHPTKARDLCLTSAVSKNRVWPEAKPAQYTEFLGLRLDARGRVSLTTAKRNEIFADLEARLWSLKRSARSLPLADRGRLVVEAVNGAFHPRSSLATNHLDLFWSLLDDDGDLRDLDYQIALRIAHALTGIRGPRAFRKVPYARMRGEWGLVSLAYRRRP